MKYFTLGKPQEYAADTGPVTAGKPTRLLGVFYRHLGQKAIDSNGDPFLASYNGTEGSIVSNKPIDTPIQFAGAFSTDASSDATQAGADDATSNTAFVLDDNYNFVGNKVPQLFIFVEDVSSIFSGTLDGSGGGPDYRLFNGTSTSTKKTGFVIGVTGNFAGEPFPFGDVEIYDRTSGYANKHVIPRSSFGTGEYPVTLAATNNFPMTYFGAPDAVAGTTDFPRFKADVSFASSGGTDITTDAERNLIHIVINDYPVRQNSIVRDVVQTFN
jgi:hypothetical protein